MERTNNRSALGLNYALNGIKTSMNGGNMRVMIVIAILAIIIGYITQVSTLEWISIILCITVTYAAEIFNTAIEQLCDFIHSDYNKDIGIVKDLSAGAVLILSAGSAITGLIIIAPKICELLI